MIFNNFAYYPEKRLKPTYTPRANMGMENYLCFLLVICMMPPVVVWIILQPKTNVWVMLAKALQQDHMCFSMNGIKDLLSTCLVEILLQPHEYPFTGKEPNLVDSWDEWMRMLPHAP